jgi:hypothetical protein
MIAMNKTSIQAKGGKGYVGFFAVYHQLHCLVSNLLVVPSWL